MRYDELVELVKKHEYMRTRWDVACYLIGYLGKLTETEFDNIGRLYNDRLVD